MLCRRTWYQKRPVAELKILEATKSDDLRAVSFYGKNPMISKIFVSGSCKLAYLLKKSLTDREA